MKQCNGCGETKPLSEYHKDKKLKSGHTGRCKTCRCAHTRNYVELNKHDEDFKRRAKFRNLKYNYGISNTEYTDLLIKQGNKCAICISPLESGHLDHCHSTGKIRGVLCHLCNVGLGFFKENSTKLEAAIKYLQSHQ